MSQTVAITGATGFLGAHLALAFLAAGYTVRAVVRTPSKADWLAERGVEIRQADITEPDQLRAAFAGTDVVVANAARVVARGGTFSESLRDNLHGADNQVSAAADAGVNRVVYVSTMAVYPSRLRRRTDEGAALRDPDRRPFDIGAWASSPTYARTKAAAEVQVWERASERQIGLTVLRPGPIYGPGASRLNERYRGWLERRVAVLPTVAFPHVHVADCAEAAVRAVQDQRSVAQAYNLAGPSVSPYVVVGALKRATGRGPRRLPLWVPTWLALSDRKVESLMGRRLRKVEEHCTDLLASDVRCPSVPELYSALQSPLSPP